METLDIVSTNVLDTLKFCIYHLKIGLKKWSELAFEESTSRTPEEKIIEDAYRKDVSKELKNDITFSGAVGKNF